MVQRLMDGPEFSIDCLSDTEGRCLNAIPRSMLESRGGESIKGTVLDDPELVDLGRASSRRSACAGRAPCRRSATARSGSGITDVNTRFGGAFPAPMYAALPGPHLPRADRADGAAASGSSRTSASTAPGVRSPATTGSSSSTSDLRPTGRDIIEPPGPPAPRELSLRTART